MSLKHVVTIGISFLLLACQQQLAVKEEEETALRHRIDAAQYNVQLGVGYLKQGDMLRAKRKLLVALRLAPQSADVQAAMGYFLEKTNDMDHAKLYYQKALALAPGSGAQKNNYGAFLCRIGDYQHAMPLLVQAGNDVSYPNSAMAYENAGLCANMMHDDAKSMLYFQYAVNQDPERPVALFELVKLLLKQHDSKKALAYLQENAAVTLTNPAFLALGAEAAQAEGNTVMAADYTQRLQHYHTGGNHEHS